ncbi:MAG: hypothetical protein GWO23_02235 [Gammaproteobacteria bacterium]|nr:hypothetical protein [Gammaproteobacteria bacterium]NIS49643.1 hypothetical protein [Phycisphaerae bacterium]
MTMRTLYNGEAVLRLNELQLKGSIGRVIILQGPEEIARAKVEVFIQSIDIVDKDGNVLAENANGRDWKFIEGVADAIMDEHGIEKIDFDLEETI